MFPQDDVRPSERLKAGRGKSDRWRTSRVTEGLYLSRGRRGPVIQLNRRATRKPSATISRHWCG
jgi:hypothetical protein